MLLELLGIFRGFDAEEGEAETQQETDGASRSGDSPVDPEGFAAIDASGDMLDVVVPARRPHRRRAATVERLSREQVIEYLELYARYFELHPHFNEVVRTVRPRNPGWIATAWRSARGDP